MANGPIRTFLINREATPGTLAATLLNEYFEPPLAYKDHFARTLMPMHNGTASGTILTALGGRWSEATIKVPLLYDALPLYLIGLFGPPTTTSDPGGAVGTFQHVFKFGPATTPPTYSIKIFNGVSDGWRQMVGAVLNTLNITGSATTPPMLTMQFIGPAATRIAVPTIPVITNLWNPAGGRALELDVNGTIANAINYNMTYDGKRTPFWTAAQSANMNRAKRGLVDIKGDVLFDYVLYTGSYKKLFDTEADLGHVLVNYTSTVDVIGTGVPTAPSAKWDIWGAIMSDAEEPDDGPEAAQKATWEANYDATNATKGTVTVINTQNAATYAGA